MGCLTSVAIVAVLLVIVFIVGFSASSTGVPKSTVQREKLETVGGFDGDCIVDELGWISNESQVKKAMKYFWEKTGVQPVLYLKEYDPSLGIFEMSKTEQDAFLAGDSDSGGWLDDWFESQGYSETTYAFVYFDGPETGELYEDHYQFYTVPGRLVGPVMDSEAEDIFFSYLESYWHMDPSVMSEDKMFSDVWTNTADRIMEKTTTRLDVAKYAVVFGIIVFIAYAIFRFMKVRRENERERNEETARILNANIHSDASESDETLDKWL